MNLAQVGFVLRHANGSEARLADLERTEQILDLWTGTLSSRFMLDRLPVHVETWVHPTADLLAVRVNPGAMPAHRIARLGVGFCPEERAIYSSLSCEENLLLPPQVGGRAFRLIRIIAPAAGRQKKQKYQP